MAFRISEKEYAALLENRDKHSEHDEEHYINGRPADTVLRGHNAPPADLPPEPKRKAKSVSNRQLGFHALGQDVKDHEWPLAAALLWGEHPMLVVVVLLVIAVPAVLILSTLSVPFEFIPKWIPIACLLAYYLKTRRS